MIRLAVYGTLKRGRGNNRLLSGSEFVGAGKTKDKYLMTDCGFPQVYEKEYTPTDCEGYLTNVTVEIFDVPDSQIARVDQLEGHPNWYCRKPIQVILNNGEEVTAEIYFMQETYNKSRRYQIVENGVY
jgi:gamma-glutamylcyclotransferase (GGCT)/AIG2-like uncharacterized protein YtfP